MCVKEVLVQCRMIRMIRMMMRLMLSGDEDKKMAIANACKMMLGRREEEKKVGGEGKIDSGGK